MVRKKKEVIKPVVAKLLNDIDKINLITSFVTNFNTDNITSSDTI